MRSWQICVKKIRRGSTRLHQLGHIGVSINWEIFHRARNHLTNRAVNRTIWASLTCPDSVHIKNFGLGLGPTYIFFSVQTRLTLISQASGSVRVGPGCVRKFYLSHYLSYSNKIADMLQTTISTGQIIGALFILWLVLSALSPTKDPAKMSIIPHIFGHQSNVYYPF